MMQFNPYQIKYISNRELMFLVISHINGIGILSMPNNVAHTTLFADGWITIGVSGCISASLGVICTNLSAQFPQHSFYEYTRELIPKTLACILTLLTVCIYLCLAAYETREISTVVNMYMLDETPLHIIAFFFLLVITYGLFCVRIALLRLTIFFFHVILLVLFFLIVLNIDLIQMKHLLPMFQTPPLQYGTTLKDTIFTFSGCEVTLFYTSLVKEPKHAPSYVFKGVLFITFLYIVIYLICVSVLSQPVLQTLSYPVIELGAGIEISTGFIERFDFIFFTAWVTNIFVTTILYIDISLLAISSIFKTLSKPMLIFICMPIVYFIAFIPSDITSTHQYGHIFLFSNLIFLIFVPTCLLLILYIKNIKKKFS